METVFRRCAYVLIPVSLLLIKYFPKYGVEYVTWTGDKMWLGVATQKNGLGVVCALSSFLIIWTFHRKWRSGALLKARSQTFADGLVLVISVFLLRGFQGMYAATAIGFMIAGIVSLLFLYRMKNNVRPVATFLVCIVAIVLLSLHFASSMVSAVTSAFNRDSSFTGRTDIWHAVLDVASRSPLLGVGYGGFWGLQDESIYSTLGVRESHSGYLDVYLDVGMVGIILFFSFLMSYYRKALKVLNTAYDWGLFGICLLIMSLIHGFTESSFLRPTYLWNSIVFVTVVFSTPYLQKRKLINPAIDKLTPYRCTLTS
jgi:O-antigen ligase